MVARYALAAQAGRCATLVGHINGTAGATREPVRLAAKRLGNGEWLIVATNRPDPKLALSDYRPVLKNEDQTVNGNLVTNDAVRPDTSRLNDLSLSWT